MAVPEPLGTLFELPVEAFGQADGDASELTAAALQGLDLEASGSGTAEPPADPAAAAADAGTGSRPGGPTCIACGIGVAGAPGFASTEEQRRHFSLDWHRYNAKRRAAGRERVGEAEFAALVEDERQEVGSISGSESEQSEAEEDEEAAAAAAATPAEAGPQFAFAGAGRCAWEWAHAAACNRAAVFRLQA